MRFCGVWTCDRHAVTSIPVSVRLNDWATYCELEVCERHARGLPRPCVNCQYRPATRASGRCDACNSYLYKYGRDRDEATVIRHNRRRFEKPA